eukprot:g303.t1
MAARTWLRRWRYMMALVLALLFVVYQHESKCNMGPLLGELLLHTANTFERHDVEYWLDYGTLLGVMRDGGIIPWEFDNDVGMMENMCERASTPEVRADFAALGYTLYNRSDHIAVKEQLTWDHQEKRLGYSNPYITTPCLRVYDRALHHFVDVYFYNRISKETARAAPAGTYNLPPRYAFERDLVCNIEGTDPKEFYPGGCRDVGLMFPLKQAPALGRTFPVPAGAVQIVRDAYPSSDAMAVGQPKGYKRLLCVGTWSVAEKLAGVAALAVIIARLVWRKCGAGIGGEYAYSKLRAVGMNE